jgi:protein required for attachment to host cells
MAAPDTDLSDLPSDADEEETLRYAISLSLREHEKATGKSVESKSSNENNSGSKQPPKTSFGSIMLDRKAMEEERLRRQAAKRPRAVEEDDEIVEVPAPKRKTVSAPSRASTVAAHPEPQRTNNFPNGAVKRTWAQGYPRTADDIKIEEVFQKERLELAVLSSFQWDEEWMLSKLNIRRTRLLLVAFAADEAQV